MFLFHAGASFAGAVAHMASIETALMTNGVLTGAALTWFALRGRHKATTAVTGGGVGGTAAASKV